MMRALQRIIGGENSLPQEKRSDSLVSRSSRRLNDPAGLPPPRSVTVSLPASAPAPWSADEAMGRMKQMSAQHVKRLFKKSASEQYKYAKSLSAEQRDILQAALENEFRRTDSPEQAVTMWLSLQHARLRIHCADERAQRSRNQILAGNYLSNNAPALVALSPPVYFRSARQEYYKSTARPEYKKAFQSFMRVIGDKSLPEPIRNQVSDKLLYHWREGTLDKNTTFFMKHLNIQDLVGMGYKIMDLTTFLQAQNKIATLNINRSSTPLGEQIDKWLKAAKKPPLENSDIFNDERYSGLLGRVLQLVREKHSLKLSQEWKKIASQGECIIRAMASDQELREKIFALSEVALGSCHANVEEGFSKLIMVLHPHQMVKDVRSGKLDQSGLREEVSRLFRLQVIETEVNNRIMQAQKFTSDDKRKYKKTLLEPLVTLQQAKANLRKSLNLPDGTVSKARYEYQFGTLTKKDLNDIYKAVTEQEKNSTKLNEFLLSNEGWRAGMMELHARKLESIEIKFQEHPFFAELPPPDNDEHINQTLAYNVQGYDLNDRKSKAIDQALKWLTWNPSANIQEIAENMFKDKNIEEEYFDAHDTFPLYIGSDNHDKFFDSEENFHTLNEPVATVAACSASTKRA